MKKRPRKSEIVSFEDSLEALKKILSDLEEGNLPLGESLEKYEAGIRHLRQCDETLKQAKAKIELLVRVDEDGKAVTKPFKHSATVEEESDTSDEAISDEEGEELQEELDEESEEGEDDEDWDGGLF